MLTIKTLTEFAHIPPQILFGYLAPSANSILLDSTNNSGADARFDILLSHPVATYSMQNSQGHLNVNDIIRSEISAATYEQIMLQSDPFVALSMLHSTIFDNANPQKLINASEQQQLANQLPFLVGAAGYAGYDTGRVLETLPSINANEYLTPDFQYSIYLHSIIFDKQETKYYLISDERATTLVDETLNALVTTIPHSAKNTLSHIPPFALTAPWQANMDKATYIQHLAQLQNYIKAGDCYQTNFAQRFTTHYHGHEYDAYLQLREHNNAPFSAFINTSHGAILSISPERFIQVRNEQVETKPIKGTMPRYEDNAKDQASAHSLLNSEKNQAENLMIVDLLRNDLSKHCAPHSVKVPKLFALESYPAVHHMVSTVTGKLAHNSSVFELLSGAFPGGSITGAPKVRAMEIIEELEPHRRNIYCGAIGYIGIRHDVDSNICIRTLLCEQGQIFCWAGGGIVLDSEAEQEYDETLAKVSKILPILEQESNWTKLNF